MNVRRVVTGQTADGRSRVADDGRVEPISVALAPGAEFHRLWGWDEPPALPVDGAAAETAQWFPPPGGVRFALVTLPPAGVAPPPDLDVEAALAEAAAKLPGLMDTFEPDMATHTTDSVDFGFVVSGEVLMELDDGEPVRLGAGDCYVQNGTRHAWRNTSAQPCVLAVAMVGVARDPEPQGANHANGRRSQESVA